MDSSIFNTKLLIVTGKGGVGKTSCASAIAHLASSYGKKTLLVESTVYQDEISQLNYMLELDDITYEKSRIKENLYVCKVNSQDAMEEYFVRTFKSRYLAKKLRSKKLVTSFVDSAPGLPQLFIIGKIYFETKNFDLIVWDSTQTGKIESFLRIPEIIADIKLGYFSKEAEKLYKQILSPEFTSFAIVTLPTEMAVSETLDLFYSIDSIQNPFNGFIAVNKMEGTKMTSSEESIFERCIKPTINGNVNLAIMNFYLNLGRRQQEEMEPLRNLDTKLFFIPYVREKRARLLTKISKSFCIPNSQNCE